MAVTEYVPPEHRKTNPELAHKIDLSLGASWKEGVVTQLMVGVFDYYLIPFALFLGATTGWIGFLVSIPTLLSAVAQFFFTVRAVELAGNRRNLLVSGTGIQAILMTPLILLALFKFPGRMLILIAVITVFRVLGSIIGPAWGSLVSDYLPENRRGQYFGWRSRMIGIAGMIGMTLWGVLLSTTVKEHRSEFGFAALFGIAVIFRLISFYYMTKMVNIPIQHTQDSDFTFWMFIRRFRESNFVKFIAYVGMITFATQLSAAYLSVYMLRDLHFGYVPYMAVSLASVITGFISFPIWGKHADVVGNAKVIKITSRILPLVAFLWAFASSPFQLILIEAFSGFVWGGFNLCTTNFIYDAVNPSKRMRCLVYSNLINGVGAFFGASLGGFLAERLPVFHGSALPTLFLLSAVLRVATNLFLRRHFREVRDLSRKVSSSELFFSVLGIRPIIGRDVEWQISPFIKPFVPRRWKQTPKSSF